MSGGVSMSGGDDGGRTLGCLLTMLKLRRCLMPTGRVKPFALQIRNYITVIVGDFLTTFLLTFA